MPENLQTIRHAPVRPGTVMRIYFKHAANHPWLFFAVVIGAIGIQIAELASPLYLKKFFNLLASQSPSDTAVESLITILGIIAFISLCSWVFRRINVFSIIRLEAQVMADLNLLSFDYLIRHSYHFFISQFAGTLTRRVTKFSHSFEVIFDAIMLKFFPTALFVIGAVVVLSMRNLTLGLVLGAWAVLFISFQIYLAKLRQPLRMKRAEEDSRVVGMLSDAIINQTTISLFSGSKHENNRFKSAVDKWHASLMRSWGADEYIWSVQGILIILINLGILYGAMRYWRLGLLTIGDFALIQAYLIGTFERMIANHGELRRFYDAFADASEMIEILDTAHGIQDAPGAKPLEIKKSEIEFKNVDFYFQESIPVLRGFNLAIKGGEKIAIVGASGAGKTTVTKLLLRLYDVISGGIEIDNQNISKVTQESLRNAIGFVPQEPVLFHRTLLENIRYGRRDATDEEIIEASKKAHSHEFISALPDGYNTFVGERGIKLSGGERQRVAIARAILKNAPILVLDEATSSLDSESEALIQDALKVLMQGKTVLVIAHRLSTIMRMDRIIVIEDGKIAADGTHSDLLIRGGLYQKLWSIQAGGFLGDDTPEPSVEEPEEIEEEETTAGKVLQEGI